VTTFHNVHLEYPLESAGYVDSQDVTQDFTKMKDPRHPPNSLDPQTSVGRVVNQNVGRGITTLRVQPPHQLH